MVSPSQDMEMPLISQHKQVLLLAVPTRRLFQG
jgi:hypothetical protein